MKFEEAKPFLKKGVKIKFLKAGLSHFSRWEGGKYIIDSLQDTVINERDGLIGNCSPGPCLSIYDELEILTEADGVTLWKDPRVKKQEFKVGDRVKAIGSRAHISNIGMWGIVIGNSYSEIVVKLEGDETKWLFLPEHLEKISDEPKVGSYDHDAFTILNQGFSTTYTYPKPIKRKESIMDNLVQAVLAKLSPVDRALVKKGYLDSKGKRTPHYEDQLREIVLQKLIDEQDSRDFRKELAGEIKAESECDEE